MKITAVHSSDEEFDFGGLVVVAAGRTDNANAPFKFRTGELLEIFKGFRMRFLEYPREPAD